MSDSVGSVSVSVVPDAGGWSAKLRAQIRDQTVTVEVDADTAKADAELAAMARTRTAKVRVDVDRSAFDRAATSFSGFLGGLGLIPSLAIPATAALIPLTGVVLGLTAALGAPLLIAGGAATLFGLLAGKAVAQTNTQLKLIAATKKSLEGLTKGTAAYAAKAKELRAQQAALSPVATQYQSSLAKVKGAFDQLLQGKTGDALLGTVAKGLDLLAKVLPGLAPLIQAVGGAFSTLIGDLSKQVSGKGFDNFIQLISKKAGPDIVTFGRIAGNAIKGFTGLLTGLDHAFGHKLLNGLLDLSRSFAGFDAGHSKTLQQFADYFYQNGPKVASTLGHVARALGNIVEALAPLGPVTLSVISGIADVISSIPIPVLTALATAFVAMSAVAKISRKISRPLGAPGGLLGGGGGGPLDVQKVFVTNPGFGGGAGGPGGFLSKIGKYAGPGTVVGAGIGIAGVTAIAAGLGLATIEFFKRATSNSPPGGETPGGMTGPQWAAFNRQRLSDQGLSNLTPSTGATAGFIKDIQPSTQTHIDALRADAARATQQIDLIGPHTKRATTDAIIALNNLQNAKAKALDVTPGSNKDVTHLQALKQNAAKATQQLDLIGPHTAASTATAVAAVENLQHHIDGIHDKKIRIIAETQSAIQALNAIRAYTIPDKNFNIIAHSQHTDLSYGPGGGVGHPGAQPSAGSGGGASAGGSTFHLHLDDNGRTTLTGRVHTEAQAVHDANQRFDGIRANR